MSLIAQAADDVIAEIDSDLPPETWPAVASVIALRTAMLIELSYYPEQVASNRSQYNELKELFDDALKRLVLAVAREQEELNSGDEQYGGVRPHHNFPVDAGGLIGWKSKW
jgi:hypothetical protein